MSVQERPDVKLNHSRCPYCHDNLKPDDEKKGCERCMAWFHSDCWTALDETCPSCGFNHKTEDVTVDPAAKEVTEGAARRQEIRLAIRETGYGVAIILVIVSAVVAYFIGKETTDSLVAAILLALIAAVVGGYGGYYIGLILGMRRYGKELSKD